MHIKYDRKKKHILRFTFLYGIQMKMTNMNCHNREFIGKVINTLATNELSKKRKKEKNPNKKCEE